jgi:hypothetical protein
MNNYDRDIQRDLKGLYTENRLRIWISQIGKFLIECGFVIIVIVAMIIAMNYFL